MQTPLQVTFHQLPPSPALETDIRLRVAELEGFFNRIVSCRVSVEAPHRHHHQGQLYSVSIDIGLPGNHIVVSRSPDADETHADPYVAVRDAFDAAKRQLEDHSRRR
jgi:ribosome-associated translation inhibitor RaiA